MAGAWVLGSALFSRVLVLPSRQHELFDGIGAPLTLSIESKAGELLAEVTLPSNAKTFHGNSAISEIDNEVAELLEA